MDSEEKPSWPAQAEPAGPESNPAWRRVQLARHPKRPHSLDYIGRLCTDFQEIHGDRAFGDDPAIVTKFEINFDAIWSRGTNAGALPSLPVIVFIPCSGTGCKPGEYDAWIRETAIRLGHESCWRSSGRPRKEDV